MTLRLEDRAVIAIAGPEARDFLQGLVTNDVRQVSRQNLRYAALLTPQGKILCDFLISEAPDGLYLDCGGATAAGLAKRLSIYRLRAKVQIEVRDDLAVAWSQAGEMTANFVPDPRHPDLCARAIVAAATAPAGIGADTFRELRLDRGIPEGADFGQDKIFALDSDLDELGGIAFDKGCYVGQELTARMKHRGTARKRLLPVQSVGGAALPAPETAVTADGRELGALMSVYGGKGFALLRLDRLDEAGNAACAAGDVTVDILRPDWLFA